MDDMEACLERWKLTEVIDIFRENCIDFEAFKVLREQDFDDLIPKLGLRRKLVQRWQECVILNKSDIIEDIVLSNINTSDVSCYSSEISTSASTSSQILTVEEEAKSQNSLLALLQSSNEGREILAHYKIHHELKRRLLVNLIIRTELTDNPDNRISRQRFIQLSKEICEIFKEENENSYYIPPKRNVKNIPISAHGKLWDKYINTRTKYRNLHLIKKSQKEKPKYSAESSEPTEDLIEKHIFLQHNTQPWTSILEYWESTSDFRRRDYEENNILIHEYFKKYPALSMPSGYSLLCIDFKNRFPTKDQKLYLEWPKIYKSILNISKKKKCPVIDQLLATFKETKKSLEIRQQEVFDQNSALLLLPLLFPNTSRKKKSNVQKYSKIEIKDSFVSHVMHEEELNVIFEQREARARILKTTEQPSVFLIGHLANPKSIVKINNIIYDLETPLKAVDTCFKSFFALNASFPVEGELVWQYIQNIIFDIYTDSDIQFNSITTVHSDILQDINRMLEDEMQNLSETI